MPLLTGLPRATRTVAPQGPTRINWGEPLTRGLVFAAPLAGQLRAPDLVGGMMPVVTTPSAGVSRLGLAEKVTSSAQILNYGQNARINTLGALSVAAWFTPIALSGAQIVSQFATSGAANHHFGLFYTVSGGCGLDVYVSGSTSATEAFAGSGIVAGTPAFLVGTFDGYSAVRIYINGVQPSGSSAIFSGVPNTAATSNLFIGSNASTTQIPNAYIQNVAIWNRALSGGEIQRLYANRWALYEPAGPQRFILALSAGGTPATVAISPITFSLAPQSVAASGAVAVGVSPISFTLTPQNLLATGAANVAINPIPFDLTPQSAASSGAASIGITPIAFNLTPQTVAATGAAGVAVTPITFNLAPQAVTATGAATVGVSPIALTLTVQSVAASVAVTTLPLHGAALDVATWHSGTADLPTFHAGGLDAGTFHANPEETP